MSVDCWLTEDAHTCFTDGLASAFGGSEPVLAMFVVGIVIIPMYMKTGDYIMPSVLLILLSALAIPILPGVLLGVAWTVIFMTIAIAVFTTLYRMVIA
ncbi:hypothetical protein [Halogeometricum limi]|uniref:Uncharacterized protein n=1 Tax=Halogeometricum limi TaxID=555875 RepID=A0A1I6FW24_9EURY|nr:hypothetical protein [Halogeometricum limi]SFR34124.1 hypothetical protein SAMN04488124_0409 [Halogeometricum limi]